jgi:ATP-binding cassette subfamily B protein
MKGSRILFFRLLALSPSIRPGVVGGVAAALRTASQAAAPLVLGFIIDDLLRTGDGGRLAQACLLLGALLVGSTMARQGQILSFTVWGEGILSRLRSRLLADLQRSPLHVFERQRSGSLTALFTTDAERAVRLVDPLLRDAVLACLQIAAILTILAVKFGALVFLAMALIPIYMALPTVFGKPARRASRRAADILAEMSAGVQESIDGIREIKAFLRERWNSLRLEEIFGAVRKENVHAGAFASLFAVSAISYGLTVAFVYWLGGRQVLSGALTIGELVALVWYLNLLGGPSTKLAGLHGKSQRALASAQRIFELLDSPKEVDRPEVRPVPREPPVVELADVWFTYSGKEQPALSGVSFRVEAGERVAVVGPSGGGKSTLFKLLLRFHEPDSGRILLGGEDLHRLSLRSVRGAIGFVPQEPVLLSVSIAENIALGHSEAEPAMEEIEAAARAAQIHDFILTLPKGYSSLAGERGAFLSVGQKQRIAIARVFLRDPSLVLLDEATSALDAESGGRVRSAMDNLFAGRTSFTITHHLSSATGADRILVLEEGRLVALGTHQSLAAGCALYRRLMSHYFELEKELEMAL